MPFVPKDPRDNSHLSEKERLHQSMAKIGMHNFDAVYEAMVERAIKRKYIWR
jgi:hypothetical protein